MKHSRVIAGIVGVFTFVLLAFNLTSAAGPAPTAPVWDAKSSADLAQALHDMHEMWNRGDMKAVENVIAGDDLLVTFELGGDDKTPVALRSRNDILSFMKKVDDDTGTQGEKYEMEMPKMSCRATDSFGVCTEECKVHLTRDSKTVRIDNLFGTAVAAKYPDGWKWIQWHMSVGPSFDPRHDDRD
jgi:hypothetical protein